jgi:peptidoglycan hydrolase-like protein with peptidoglycan-binding domain
MSAGMMPRAAEPKPSRDLSLLAPKFRAAVEAALAECDEAGLNAMVYEGHRSMELQVLYYARGRTVKPPYHTVTNASSNLYSWHGYGLAVDVIHETLYWNPPAGWWSKVAAIFKKHGCDWGGDWQRVDLPHFQWGTLRVSPSSRARQLLAEGGVEAVWREVGADGPAIVPVARPRLLTLGVQGQDVADLQKQLGAPVTGVFDPVTDAWVRGFQLGKGLTVDGDVGPLTRAALP